GHGGAMAQLQVSLHRRPAQIELAMLEPHRFRDVLLVELEGRGERDVEDLDMVGEDLDLAAGRLGVDGALGSRPHEPGRGNDEFMTQLFGDGKGRGAVGIAHDLHQAFAVAQIDEDDAAVVASAMDPAADGYRLAEASAVDAAAVVGTFQVYLRQGCKGRVGCGQAIAGRVAASARRPATSRPINFAELEWLARRAPAVREPCARA